jgi:hypothetical protein
MMPTTISPTSARPGSVVDIKLTQHPNQFFFPGNTISGQVIYESGDEDENFELFITFSGVNSTVFKGQKKHTDHAILFQYENRLHSGLRKRGTGRVGMSRYPFNFRFPSNTDNRSFIQPRDSVASETWTNSVHELPPSFDLETPGSAFSCSVEYVLRVELYHDRNLSASTQLPIVFLPFRANSLRHGITLIPGIMHSADTAPARRDSAIEVTDTVNYKLIAEAPHDIIVGRTFRLEAYLRFDTQALLEEHLLNAMIRIDKLRIVCTTSCRAFRRSTNSTDWGSEEYSMSLIANPIRPNTSTRSNELRFSFEATMPSASSPTFRSFLISNTYHLQALFSACVDGESVELELDAPDIPVLSPVAPTLAARRIAAPMIPTSHQQGRVFGRALTCQI